MRVIASTAAESCSLTSRGVEFIAPPKTADWGTMAIFKDPDGNQFVLGTK